MEISSKSGLAIALSKLKIFAKPKPELEQYPTESEIAAEIVWFARMKGDISGKVIVDLGCGTGLLGIAALSLGAKLVYFVDIDKEALKIAEQNLDFIDDKLQKKAKFIQSDVTEFQAQDVDVVLQNPPFGVQVKHADFIFLEAAFKLAPVIYTFHKLETRKFIDDKAAKNSYKTTHFWTFDWPLKMTMEHHKKRIQYIKVACWRLEKSI
jgi:putative methylase